MEKCSLPIYRNGSILSFSGRGHLSIVAASSIRSCAGPSRNSRGRCAGKKLVFRGPLDQQNSGKRVRKTARAPAGPWQQKPAFMRLLFVISYAFFSPTVEYSYFPRRARGDGVRCWAMLVSATDMARRRSSLSPPPSKLVALLEIILLHFGRKRRRRRTAPVISVHLLRHGRVLRLRGVKAGGGPFLFAVLKVRGPTPADDQRAQAFFRGVEQAATRSPSPGGRK